MINTDNRPERKEDSYYAIPDWETLRQEAERKLAADSNENVEAVFAETEPTIEDTTVTSIEDTIDEDITTDLSAKKPDSEGIEAKTEDEHVDINHVEVGEEGEKSKKKDIWEPF